MCRASTLLGVVMALVLSSAPASRAAHTLPLGSNTACVLMSEPETRATLGLKKRHVLACADPTGKVVRVVITRKGNVDCIDGVQLGANGPQSIVGTACTGIRPAAQDSVPPVVNLSGAWLTTVPPYGSCDTTVQQNGDQISISATCLSIGVFSASGTIDFSGLSFDSHGTANIPGYGYCADGRMTGSITPDGQHASGTVSCAGLALSFTSDRR